MLWLPASLSANEEPILTVIYPKDSQVIGATDSTFVFGNIGSISFGDNWSVDINGHCVSVHEGGGFLAYVPVEPGDFEFNVTARLELSDKDLRNRNRQKHDIHSESTTLSATVAVIVPMPLTSFPTDSLQIGSERRLYSGDLDLTTGNRLVVSFQATPGCDVSFSIPGVVDTVPMTEIDPQMQSYWGESVFGIGAVPDSLKIKGIYTGFYDVPNSVRTDSAIRLEYHLAPPCRDSILARYFLSTQLQRDSLDLGNLSLPDTIISAGSSYSVTLNSAEYPFTVRFTDTVQIIRHGPRKGYLALFQPQGVEALAVGRVGEWYMLRFSATQVGWAFHESVEQLPKGDLPPQSHLVSLRTRSYSDRVVLKCALSGKHLFRVEEENRRIIRIRLYGVTSDTDWIRYDANDELIDIITWFQPEPGLYELTLQLTRDIWGYDSYYEGSTFVFQLNRPPQNINRLHGKTIVIDPGHSGDPGAIGATGYTEAEANLGIALVLEKMLRKKGVTVVMTRSDTSHVPLYDRPAIAWAHDADLFISIHNNALPDGVNPFVNNGTSVYYYHPHSLNLARAIHPELVKATDLDDHGLYHGNLAVLRPTQYPAVLVECAFMMIPEQEANLKTGRFRYRIAKGICKGIENFLKEYNREQ
ncbi:MAG: N-acetylmuramoyl-L-alanine amidase [candidate division Zixibacteria bacterium]|nr:N-acetylmuramoyl-L-alanine amidase [candidate division Zixibacteria bacterium]